MRKPFAVVAALGLTLGLVLAVSPAFAQPAAQKGKGAAGQVRYFDLSASIFSELGSEAILKENRRGTTLVSAELDVCHLISPTSDRLDRFVVPLKVEGNRLTGTAQSQEGKHAVTVNLTRRAMGDNVTFEGSITSGSNTDNIRSTDNIELSEEEITDQYLGEPAIEASPANFAAAWLQALHVRVGREGLIGLADALREQNVRVVYNGLLPSCRLLRFGHYTLQVDVDAERVGAVLAKLKTVPGVTEVGFSPNPPNMQRAVRFPSAGWRDASGKLDRDKLGAAIGAAMAKAMSATLVSTSWDATMGELTVELKRPDEPVAGLKLAQLVTILTVVGPESLSSNRQSIVWIEAIASRIVDERPSPNLTFSIATEDSSEGQTSEPEDSDSLPDAIAAALKGVSWDSDKEQWRRQ
ncbi:MAG: hypothetical protein GEU95_19920 [Rhizobiales bacterium]|nr:hypothetical protein [Hyphomicrobiales bacterium]